MVLQTLLKRNEGGFRSLCQTHKVKKMYAFGSSLTDRFDNKTSDIDLAVEVDIDDPVERGEKLLSLWDHLEIFFGRRVDLVVWGSIKNPFLKTNLERTRKLIYDREGEKVLI
jgi:uncharacterized protein